ncbi:FMN-binding glutamate synthase family protein [Desulfallas thermosapovorans]|uniref:Glutamate synthase (NADPH) GltB2 subunit n=1 Tax=Desulfallas thermosapovorans DSM 6562 TaxID=1121431 RepID=A0A5S4ZTK5_9FIRM|nr:FMN-binding glutamate synthase family protein [Desulfallas thermosapovorans]TYO96204.1 glutamate synthase (NADPH) GltB2 subunit [Desulfallas thermosapovorans DSM 6562]
MGYSNGINASAATLTKNRTPGNVCSSSGLCATCLDGCPGLCEVGKSAYRGRELIYPQPFGCTTSASQKDYPVDLSHLNIMGTAVGAYGIEADSDKATFPAVNLETEIGSTNTIKLKLPIVIPGLGSTQVAKDNWEGLAIGAAISGIVLTIGENVCGMDPDGEIKNGRVVKSPDMERRVKLFREWYNGYGAIVVQFNVEDTRLGVAEYVINDLGVEAVEIKWGQGAKDIGGEVKLPSLERARQLKSRGYIVYPDPENPDVQQGYAQGTVKEFERHSRIGMVDEESFMTRVSELRGLGAKHVMLKTGAYRPADLARAVKFASLAKIDLLTVDGAGGGTGMSPWRMMNEWGVPTVYLESLLYQYMERIKAKGMYVPKVAVAGGFSLEDHMYKGLALAAPYVKAIGMARAPLAAAMVGKTIGSYIKEGKVPADITKRYGNTVEQIFTASTTLKQQYGEDVARIPTSAMGVYNYFDRLAVGLQQLMCGARKFSIDYITRDDLASITREAAQVTGIPYIMDLDAEEVEKILG